MPFCALFTIVCTFRTDDTDDKKKNAQGKSGGELLRREKRKSVAVSLLDTMRETAGMSKAEIESYTFLNARGFLQLPAEGINLWKGKLSIENFLRLVETARMAEADAAEHRWRFLDLNKEFCRVQKRLRWHENVRDWVSATARSAVEEDKELPNWIVLEGIRCGTSIASGS